MVNIDYRTTGPGRVLSNLYPATFTFEGVECASMEGFLQSLKFQDTEEQTHACSLAGFYAKNIGKKAADWRDSQTLWWRGKPVDRHSREYLSLIYKAMLCKYTQHKESQEALMATLDEKLLHTIGHSNPNETILTRIEFCAMTEQIRSKLYTNEFIDM